MIGHCACGKKLSSSRAKRCPACSIQHSNAQRRQRQIAERDRMRADRKAADQRIRFARMQELRARIEERKRLEAEALARFQRSYGL